MPYCSAVSPRSPDKSLSSQSRRPLVNDSRVPPEIKTWPPHGAYQLVAKAEEEFDVLRQIEGSRGLPKPSRAVDPRWSARIPSPPDAHNRSDCEMVKAGQLSPCEFINVESEFAAMSVSIGASAPARGPTPRRPAKGCCS